MISLKEFGLFIQEGGKLFDGELMKLSIQSEPMTEEEEANLRGKKKQKVKSKKDKKRGKKIKDS